jgi:transcriptional regulator with XRE-family HTH domain
MELHDQILSKSDIVSQRVHYLMFINGRLTQKRLAPRLGMAVSTITTKMTGRNRWNIDEVDALANVFGVTPNYLFGYEPIESARAVNPRILASVETRILDSVAGTGFEPATSGL